MVCIYIDETGIFSKGKNGKGISGVGALAIPDCSWPQILKKYNKLRPKLLKSESEVKGKNLDEVDIAKVIDLLRRNDALFECTLIDMQFESSEIIQSYQARHVSLIGCGTRDEITDHMLNKVENLQSYLKTLTPQLYIQTVIANETIARLYHHLLPYYAQRKPSELGRFSWMIDGKEVTKKIDWEVWWNNFIFPWLQSRFLSNPPVIIEGEGFDYTFFEKFKASSSKMIKDRYGIDDAISIDETFKDIKFSSDALPGLELADILTTATRRAFANTLGVQGYEGLANIMVKPGHEDRVKFMSFNNSSRVLNKHHAFVLDHLNKCGKNMLLDKYRSKK